MSQMRETAGESTPLIPAAGHDEADLAAEEGVSKTQQSQRMKGKAVDVTEGQRGALEGR